MRGRQLSDDPHALYASHPAYETSIIIEANVGADIAKVVTDINNALTHSPADVTEDTIALFVGCHTGSTAEIGTA